MTLQELMINICVNVITTNIIKKSDRPSPNEVFMLVWLYILSTKSLISLWHFFIHCLLLTLLLFHFCPCLFSDNDGFWETKDRGCNIYLTWIEQKNFRIIFTFGQNRLTFHFQSYNGKLSVGITQKNRFLKLDE